MGAETIKTVGGEHWGGMANIEFKQAEFADDPNGCGSKTKTDLECIMDTAKAGVEHNLSIFAKGITEAFASEGKSHKQVLLTGSIISSAALEISGYEDSSVSCGGSDSKAACPSDKLIVDKPCATKVCADRMEKMKTWAKTGGKTGKEWSAPDTFAEIDSAGSNRQIIKCGGMQDLDTEPIRKTCEESWFAPGNVLGYSNNGEGPSYQYGKTRAKYVMRQIMDRVTKSAEAVLKEKNLPHEQAQVDKLIAKVEAALCADGHPYIIPFKQVMMKIGDTVCDDLKAQGN